MNRYQKRYLSIFLFFAFSIFTIVLIYHTDVKKPNYLKILNLLPQLQLSKDDIPVVVCDEHEEVIPYWYKAVEEGLILPAGNTLIHIDAHSDMAPPENSESVKLFNPKISPKYNNMLPLMQSNDVFIVSAIMKGLIDHVVWVEPSWNNGSERNKYTRNYVGVSKTLKNKDNMNFPCICQQLVYKKIKKKTPFECFIVDRESPNEKEIETSDCEMIKSYIMILVNEDRFVESVKLNKIRGLFVDFDEDYFGVQSGVKAFMDKGIRYNTVVQLDSIFNQIFCPTSNKEEEDLNEHLKELFDDLWELSVAHENLVNKRLNIQELLNKHIADYVCPNIDDIPTLLNSITDYIAIIKKEEFKGLSQIAFCLSNSPRLHVTPRFGLCHGTIFPEDTLNQIHVSNFAAIEKRAKNLESILDFVYKHKEPKFFSISRSLRDGYTPRFQQTKIEELLLKSITNVIRRHNKKERIIYDEHLVFGRKGWIFDTDGDNVEF